MANFGKTVAEFVDEEARRLGELSLWFDEEWVTEVRLRQGVVIEELDMHSRMRVLANLVGKERAGRMFRAGRGQA